MDEDSRQSNGSAPSGQLGEDSRPPNISRKVVACVCCRRQKIKCHMKDGKPPCTRCKKRGLSCTVNRSLQMILESDSSWKDETDGRIRSLEAAVKKIANHFSVQEILNDAFEQDSEPATPHPVSSPAQPTRPEETHPIESYEMVMDPESGPAAIPGSVVSPTMVASTELGSVIRDIVSQQIISIDQAQTYLDVYQNRLDHFLYRIIGDPQELSGIRASSPLLLAAICTVGALHLASPDFEKCYHHFVAVASAQTFSRSSNLDDVRGLCIAAFWLSGISWTCIGIAIRISTETLQLHRSIFKALAGDRMHYLRTRLYYLIFVCDHHSSIVYGRPSMTRSCEAIRASSDFLQSTHAVEDDTRLVSQVQLWSVCREIYKTFGVNLEKPLDAPMIAEIRRCSIKLDVIRADWSDRFTRNPYVGNYPRKGVNLHHHFSKLYLHSMALRGIGKPGFKSPDVAMDIDELANVALLSATAILRAINDTEIQSYLNGLPMYFDIMIAFAVVFVLKAAMLPDAVRVDHQEIRGLVSNVVSVLKQITSTMHPRHLLVSVARGAEELLQKCSPQLPNPDMSLNQPVLGENLFNLPNEWSGFDFDHFLNDYDFLS